MALRRMEMINPFPSPREVNRFISLPMEITYKPVGIKFPSPLEECRFISGL